MLDAANLVRDGKIDPDAMAAAKADGNELVTALRAAVTAAVNADAQAPVRLAALAILIGTGKHQAALPALVPLLERDGVAGKAAAWALAQLAAERELLSAVTGGKLDQRDNGYYGLMALAALGGASAGLGEVIARQVDTEIERAKGGGTGLGEHACRVLAILGAKNVPELAQRVIENDRFCDRFELQRLRKAVEDGGRDSASVRDFSAPWAAVFADSVYAPPAPAPAPAPAPTAKLASAPSAGRPAPGAKPPLAHPAGKPPAAKPPQPSAAGAAGAADSGDDDADDLGPDGEDAAALAGNPAAAGPAAQPIDWKDFLASPEAASLAPQVKTLTAQLGPVLEQLAVRAIQAPLTDLSGQELASLLLQVLPQALPPQAVQAALSPQGLNGFQAIAKYLSRTGLATAGDDLVQGVKIVRSELANQVRQSGILGGPDYSDPDEAPALKK